MLYHCAECAQVAAELEAEGFTIEVDPSGDLHAFALVEVDDLQRRMAAAERRMRRRQRPNRRRPKRRNR